MLASRHASEHFDQLLETELSEFTIAADQFSGGLFDNLDPDLTRLGAVTEARLQGHSLTIDRNALVNDHKDWAGTLVKLDAVDAFGAVLVEDGRKQTIRALCRKTLIHEQITLE
jgi:hypothetical protein